MPKHQNFTALRYFQQEGGEVKQWTKCHEQNYSASVNSKAQDKTRKLTSSTLAQSGGSISMFRFKISAPIVKVQIFI